MEEKPRKSKSRVKRIIGWVLLIYGGIGAVVMLSEGPTQLYHSLPGVILCVGIGSALIYESRTKPPVG